MKLQRGTFTISDSECIPGYYDPDDKWNGWLNPYFESDAIDMILRLYGPSKPTPELEGKFADQVKFAPKYDCFMSATCVCRDGHWELDSENNDRWTKYEPGKVMDTVDGRKKLYPLGHFEYTWSLADPTVCKSKTCKPRKVACKPKVSKACKPKTKPKAKVARK